MAPSAKKYVQVMEGIREKIISGEYPIDSKLPSEPMLQRAYGVSRVTVRLAVDGLVRDGRVERIQGKGTYVRKPQRVNRLVRQNSVESFSEVARESGFIAGTKVLRVERVDVDARLRNALQTDADQALHTLRLRCLDGDPVFLESNCYPLPRFETLPNYDLTGSLYAILSEHFGIVELASDDTTLSVRPADVETARLLERSVGFPLFYMETQIFDQRDRVVQYGEQLIATDRYQFKI